jgi:hypothetical protein
MTDEKVIEKEFNEKKDIHQEADYIKRINFYDANEWVKWGEVQQGHLL